MLRYSENKVSSAEIFRLALQKMTEIGSSFTPVHYTVVYEYVTGINPSLSEAMDSLLKAGKTLSDPDVERLFLNYVAPEFVLPLANHRDSLTQDIQSLLDRLSASTLSTSQEAERVQKGLESYSLTLKKYKSPEISELDAVIRGVLQNTVSMQKSSGSLEMDLKESRKEIEILQQELRTARVEALLDPLTGLLNRRGLDLQMEKYGNNPASGTRECSFLMIDIDFFKKVNDSHGHMIGDKVIQALAKALKLSTRGGDAVARVGGEEFAVVLPETSIQKAHIVAEHIRKNVEHIEIMNNKTRKKIGGITVSIGIDLVELGKEDWHRAMERADKALYQSKMDGRNRTTIFYGDRKVPSDSPS